MDESAGSADFHQPLEETEMSHADGDEARASICDDRHPIKLQQQCREMLQEIRECTFLVQSTDILKGLQGHLSACLAEIRGLVPQEDGLPLLPSPERKTQRKTSKVHKSSNKDLLQKLLRRRKHPGDLVLKPRSCGQITCGQIT